MIIVATVTPDMLFPATACLVQDSLGLTNACAFDVSAACSGFLYGLSIASSLIATGAHRNGARDRRRDALADRRTGPTATPASCSATAPARRCSRRPRRHAASCSRPARLDGVAGRHARHARAADRRIPISRDGARRAARTTSRWRATSCSSTRCARWSRRRSRRSTRPGVSAEDLDLLIPHQANLRIIDATAERLGVPMEKVFMNIDRYGNTSAASDADRARRGVRTAFERAIWSRSSPSAGGHVGAAASCRGARRLASLGRGRALSGGEGGDESARSRSPSFPGQGSQVVGMGRALSEAYPEAREVFAARRRGARLRALGDLLRGARGRASTQTENTQPALLAHSVAALRVLEARGIRARGRRRAQRSASTRRYVAARSRSFDATRSRLVRRRGELMADAGRERPGRDGGDPRARRRRRSRPVCREARTPSGVVVAANFNSPGPGRDLGRGRRGRAARWRATRSRRREARDPAAR